MHVSTQIYLHIPLVHFVRKHDDAMLCTEQSHCLDGFTPHHLASWVALGLGLGLELEIEIEIEIEIELELCLC
jgi:hypothetical protein